MKCVHGELLNVYDNSFGFVTKVLNECKDGKAGSVSRSSFLVCIDHALNSAPRDVIFLGTQGAQDNYQRTECHEILEEARRAAQTVRASYKHTATYAKLEKRRVQRLQEDFASLQELPANPTQEEIRERTRLEANAHLARAHKCPSTDVVTRFNSTFLFLDGLVESITSVPTTVWKMSERKIQILQQIVYLLIEFYILVTEFEGDQYATVASVYPGVIPLLQHLQEVIFCFALLAMCIR